MPLVAFVAFILILATAFVAAGYFGSEFVSDFPYLSYFHEARGHHEPNFFGALIVCMIVFSVFLTLSTLIVRMTTRVQIDNDWLPQTPDSPNP